MVSVNQVDRNPDRQPAERYTCPDVDDGAYELVMRGPLPCSKTASKTMLLTPLNRLRVGIYRLDDG